MNGSPANIGSSVSGSNGGTFTIESNGAFTFNPGNDFDSLGAGATATTTVTYQMTDSQGGFSTATVTITVTGLTRLRLNPDCGSKQYRWRLSHFECVRQLFRSGCRRSVDVLGQLTAARSFDQFNDRHHQRHDQQQCLCRRAIFRHDHGDRHRWCNDVSDIHMDRHQSGSCCDERYNRNDRERIIQRQCADE